MDDSQSGSSEFQDTLDSFDINLVPDEGEGGFHTKNNPRQPFQRSTVHQDRRSIGIKCSLVDVVHGLWEPDSDEEYASLVVLEFRFESGGRARRLTSARITVTFFGEDTSDDHPGVANISFNGSYSLLPTTQSETVTSGVDGNIGANVLGSGQLTLNKKYEKVVSREASDATLLSGTTCMLGVRWDPDNAAEWRLTENATDKTGIPARVRVGLLVKRETQENFRCAVEIESEADLRSTFGRWFGQRPKDDPVLFNPNLKPTNRLMKYDTKNLGAMDLELVADVTFTTVLDGVIKKSAVVN